MQTQWTRWIVDCTGNVRWTCKEHDDPHLQFSTDAITSTMSEQKADTDTGDTQPTDLSEIPGYPKYYCTRDGRIYSDAHDWRGKGLREMSQQEDKDGYLYVRPTINGAREKLRVHRAVLKTFDRSPKPSEETRHLDGDPKNNNISNLEWGTRSDNAKDRTRHGNSAVVGRGSKNPQSKLNESRVAAARILFGQGVEIRALAELYGVTPQTLRKAVRGVTWRHVPAPDLIAAAGTAASELPEECDPVAALKELPRLLDALQTIARADGTRYAGTDALQHVAEKALDAIQIDTSETDE